MNTKTAQQIAIAFKRGLAFIRGIKRMAQDADPDEKWITIGAAEGDDGKRHGGRPVCISKSTGKIIKGLSKDVVGMTLNEAFKELKKTPEEKEADRKAAEQKAAAEKKAAEQKAAAEKKAAEQKAAAEKKAAEEKKKAGEKKPEQGSLIPENKDVEEIKKTEIKDFGEYLAGARKDLYKSLDTELTSEDLLKKPLSKTWPVDSLNDIQDNNVAAAVMALRMQVDRKPSSRWGRGRWVDEVNELRSKAAAIVKSGKVSGLEGNARRTQLLLANLPRASWGDVSKVGIGSGSISPMLALRDAAEGKLIDLRPKKMQEEAAKAWARGTFSGNYPIYDVKTSRGEFNVITAPGKDFAYMYDSKAKGPYEDEAMKALADIIQTASPETEKAKVDLKKKAYTFNIYWDRNKNKYFIAKKGDRNYTPLKEFDDVKDARLFNTPAHALELTETYNAIKASYDVDESKLRFRSNERHGGDYRKGKATTPSDYDKAFGFRGVQFGNWVAQSGELSSQNLMDQAYDALHDLSKVTGITTKDISLDGSLGLAFGARGVGGKNAALAHYEPDTKVINLTKYGGAGCVAHEWFHAMDNYIVGTGADNYGTENTYKLRQSEKLYKAAVDLHRALHDTDFYKAAQKADKYRSKAYWTTIREMAARGFEGYVKDKMESKGESNHFLVNYAPSDLWPSKSDLKKLAPLYDAYIKAIKETRWEKMAQDAIPEELIRYSTRWVTIGRGARIMVDSTGTIRAGLGGKYNGRQFADVFKSREITGEKAALEKPEEQIEEMTEEQHAGEVNGAGVLDKLINGVSVWP